MPQRSISTTGKETPPRPARPYTIDGSGTAKSAHHLAGEVQHLHQIPPVAARRTPGWPDRAPAPIPRLHTRNLP